MGTSRSPQEMVRKIESLATVTERKAKAILGQGALTGKEIILAEAASRGVLPQSKIAGGKWGVRYDIKGTKNPVALLRITGPFQLVERDTAPHMIYRRSARARGRGAKRINRQATLNQVFGGRGAYTGGAMKFPDGQFRHVVHHPGTKGKGIFKAAKAKAGKAVPIVMSQRLSGFWADALR